MFTQRRDEDRVDHHVRCWATSLFSFLALVTWLMALTPTLIGHAPMPKYKATCWCPSSFMPSMVQYTNTHCSHLFNAAIHNGTAHRSFQHLVVPNFSSDGGFLAASGYLTTTERSVEEKEEEQEKPEAIFSGEFVKNSLTPLTLFMFALSLQIPLFLRCWIDSHSSLNIEQVLDSAAVISKLSEKEQFLVSQRMAKVTTDSKISKSMIISPAYILLKCTTSFIVGCQLFTTIYLNRMVDTSVSVNDVNNYEGAVRYCTFGIRQLTNVHRHVVQCIYSQAARDEGLGELFTDSLNTSSNLDIYKTLFEGLVIYLTLLFVLGLLSMLNWTARLTVISNRYPIISLDGKLLACFSLDNSNPMFSSEMIKMLSSTHERDEPPLTVM